MARLKKDIAAKGITFFQEIDQSALAAKAGIELKPSILLIFGNPPLGTQFMTANPQAGLDWPVRLLVYRDASGAVWVAYTDFAWIAKRHGVKAATRNSTWPRKSRPRSFRACRRARNRPCHGQASRGHARSRSAASARIECPTYDDTPPLAGKPLGERRVAIISTAGLHKRGDRPFRPGDGSYRVIPAETPANELVMSHISVNFDRTGFQQDLNVVFPIDRLRELVAEGSVGSMAAVHYSFMGAFPPAAAEPHAQHLAGLLKADKVDAALLVPV